LLLGSRACRRGECQEIRAISVIPSTKVQYWHVVLLCIDRAGALDRSESLHLGGIGRLPAATPPGGPRNGRLSVACVNEQEHVSWAAQTDVRSFGICWLQVHQNISDGCAHVVYAKKFTITSKRTTNRTPADVCHKGGANIWWSLAVGITAVRYWSVIFCQLPADLFRATRTFVVPIELTWLRRGFLALCYHA